MSAQHTPTPWEYVPSNENHGAYVVAPHGGDICDCYAMSNPYSSAVCNGGNSYPIPFQGYEADANAEFIVRACNAHDELVMALQDGRTQIEYLHQKFQATGSGNGTLARIDAALAKAQTQS